MDLWIGTTKPALLDLLKRVDLLVLNDSEARQLTSETSLIKAGPRSDPATAHGLLPSKRANMGAYF